MKATRSRLGIIAVAVVGITSVTATSCTTMRARPVDHGINTSADPKVIERGHYLVYGPAHCASCHGDPARENELRQGQEIPPSGGRTFALGMVGTLVAPNITSDAAFGIGGLSDETLVRSLRYGISRHGRPLVPIMSFTDLADDDLRAIVSYLRTVPPVSRPAAPHRLSLLGTVGVNFVLNRQGPIQPPPSQLTPERTAEYGGYLAPRWPIVMAATRYGAS